MTDKAKKFLEAVSADEGMKVQLERALKGAENADQIPIVVAFAGKHGYEITENDFTTDGEDIALDKLDAVNGGGGCGCAVGGGGEGDGLVCGCIIYGTGGMYGDKSPDSQGGCICPVAGAGASNRH